MQIPKIALSGFLSLLLPLAVKARLVDEVINQPQSPYTTVSQENIPKDIILIKAPAQMRQPANIVCHHPLLSKKSV